MMTWIVILSVFFAANAVSAILMFRQGNKYTAAFNGLVVVICLVALLHAIWVQ